MRLLLESGADPNATNNEGKTPRDLVPGPAETPGPRMDMMKHIRYILAETQGKQRPERTWKVPKIMPRCATKQQELTQKDFFVNICFYYRQGSQPRPRSQRISVFELVYGGKLKQLENDYLEFLGQEDHSLRGKITTRDIWKWVHFPANNVGSLPSCTTSLRFQRADIIR